MNTQLALPLGAAMPALESDRIRQAVAVLLLDPAFARAPRMCHLLSFLVEKKLAGREREISEYTIGLDVFRRDSRLYDTCLDPVVRVQVGRLRSRLAAFYAAAGAPLGVHITLPQGSYVPVIERVAVPSPSGPRRLELVPLRNLSEQTDSAGFVSGVNEELGSRLFDTLGKQVRLPGVQAAAWDARARHRLEGSIRVEARHVRASIRLVDTDVGDIAWLSQFDCRGELGMHLQEELAGAICDRLRRYLSELERRAPNA